MSDIVSKKDGFLRELKKPWKNWLFRSLFLLMIIILSVFIFREALVFILKTEYPLHTPISTSMVPTLKVGDLLIVRGGLSSDDIYAHLGDGDIIVFQDPRNPKNFPPIVHRVVDKFQINGTWYFVTKGDNNTSIDHWSWWHYPKGGVFQEGGVPENLLIGKVIGVIPLLGYIKIYLGTPLGTVISIILIAVLLFLENRPSSERIEKLQEREETTKTD